MSAATSPLIALLRRHLRVAALLFAGVLLLKSLFAVSCAADSYAGDVDYAPVQLQAAFSTDAAACVEPGAGGCWHEGSGGCHCACAHAAPLLMSQAAPVSIAVVAALFPSALVRTLPAPPEDQLRPPIA
ncbi:hypothetical protein [Tahibacter harae]|uniref:DUF2946 family protein n=1 Tax=Tahibacter harae TaxID=2963937 RepID=A0ABT1QMX7_9GAMM|nr:hypothetical protein [Tahibacter harae]MCQ4163385.1 hypothetical protein [Tahibacter harae]